MANDDPDIARYFAQGDQFRATVRDAAFDMPAAQTANLVRTTAGGDLSGLDEQAAAVVGWLALVAILDLLDETRSQREGP